MYLKSQQWVICKEAAMYYFFLQKPLIGGIPACFNPTVRHVEGQTGVLSSGWRGILSLILSLNKAQNKISYISIT